MNRLDLDYLQLVDDVVNTGQKSPDRTNTGTISKFAMTIRHNMFDGFPLLTTKEIHFKSVFTELKWFLLGRTDLKYLLDRNCTIWLGDAYKKYKKSCSPDKSPLSIEEFKSYIQNNSSNEFNDLGPIYGKQWRDFNGMDQIKDLLNEIHNNPFSRRLLVSSWNPSELNQMILPPCHYVFECYVHILSNEDKEKYGKEYGLSLMWHQRSADVGLGVPFNIASYGLLLHIFCKILNMLPIELIGTFGNTHVYNNHIDLIDEQFNRKSYSLPKIEISDDLFFDNVFDNIQHFDAIIERLSEEDVSIINYKHSGKLKLPLSN